MKSQSMSYVLLLVAVTFGSCSSDNNDVASENQVWQTSLVASKLGGDIENLEEADTIVPLTRSLFIGGQTGNRFVKLWDQYDVAQVYKDGVCVGTLTPSSIGNLYSTLTGILEGSYSVGDEITIYMPSPDLDYTGQDGTIGSMSRYFDFMMTTAKVAQVEGSTIITDELQFASRQSYLKLVFRDENNLKLHVKQVIVKPANDLLVATKKMDGTTTYTDRLVINTVMESSTKDYPSDIYVALLNEANKKVGYTFEVLATDDKIYKTKTTLSSNLYSGGSLTTSVRATTCATVDLDVQTSITPPESDEPDVEQVTL